MLNMHPQIMLVSKLFILMGIGTYLRKKNLIPTEGKKLLTDLVIHLLLPCSIITSFLTDISYERLQQAGQIFLLSLGIQLGSWMVGLAAYRRCQTGHQTVMQYATLCPNSGILGTPIAEGLFGAEGTLLSAVFLIPLRVAMWTLGLSFFTRNSEKFSLKRILTHPCIAAVLTGLILMLLQIRLPLLAVDCLKTVGGCNTVISMILVGSIIADMNPKLMFHRDTFYYTFIRLIMLPMAVLLVCRLIEIDPCVCSISVILTAMPAGATTSILALKYGADADFASACTALTTVLSLVAVPLWYSFLL